MQFDLWKAKIEFLHRCHSDPSYASMVLDYVNHARRRLMNQKTWDHQSFKAVKPTEAPHLFGFEIPTSEKITQDGK